MSVFTQSVAHSPFSSITQFQRMDQATSKFTAVNNSQDFGPDSTRSFAFRPDSSVTILANGQAGRESNGAGTTSQQSPVQQSTIRASSPEHRSNTNLPDSQGLYDNIDVGSSVKRRRSSYENEDQARRPAPPDASPTRLAEQATRYINAQRDRLEHKSATTKTETTDTPMLERPRLSFGGADLPQETPDPPRSDTDRPPPEDHDLVAPVDRDMKRYTATSPEFEDISSPEPSPPLDDVRQSTFYGGQRPSSNGDTPPTIEKKKRQFTRRTKTGCITCRRRKKKCDEAKPTCENCIKGGFTCDGYGPKKPDVSGSSTQQRHHSQPQQHHDRGIAQSVSSGARRELFHAAFRPQPPLTFAAPPPSTVGASPFRSGPDLFGHGHRPSWPPGPQAWGANPGATPTSTVKTPREDERPTNAMSPDSGRESVGRGYETPLTGPSRLGHNLAPASNTIATASPPSMMARQIQPTRQVSVIPPTYAADTRFDTQRSRMLAGRPYRQFDDPTLLDDRDNCRAALERYNNAARPSQGASEEECGRLFRAIIMPGQTRASPAERRVGGSVGQHFMIQPPFKCEYGYNIHIGDHVIIQTNCFMQDPCRITIGSRTVVGPDVKFYAMTLPMNSSARGGSRGLAIGAPITIEEDCYIGPGVIINAGVTIKKGSVIQAGTVVSQNVVANVEYGGSPPEILRGISVPESAGGEHYPLKHIDDDVASLMLKERGWVLGKP